MFNAGRVVNRLYNCGAFQILDQNTEEIPYHLTFICVIRADWHLLLTNILAYADPLGHKHHEINLLLFITAVKMRFKWWKVCGPSHSHSHSDLGDDELHSRNERSFCL